MKYYLCFKVNKVPDLTMAKYKVFDISGQEDLIAKHNVFLRQLHRLGVESNVFFHLLFFYDGAEGIAKGKRLQIIFYATAESPKKLELIREFVITSVLSTYYEFYCYEISSSLVYLLKDGYLQFTNLSGTKRIYKLSNAIDSSKYDAIHKRIEDDGYLYCSIQPGTNEVTEINSESFYLDSYGRIGCDYTFDHGCFLTKKDYHLYAQNRLYNDPKNVLIPIYSIMEWIPNTVGRLYNVMKLMEGYNETAALRIDLFSVDVAEAFNDNMAATINELRQRMSQHDQGKDDNCDTVLKSIEGITKKLMKYPQFFANVIAFADHKDISVMLADSVGAEAVESGSYLVKELSAYSDDHSYEIYSYDSEVVLDKSTYNKDGNYMSEYVSLYTLDEIRPMFTFPVLYPGETIECAKETDPEFEESKADTLFLGTSETGYSVNFPIKLLNKHAFIAGVPGSGKTNTMLYMVSELWNKYHIPFLVLEPAKQEYRALAKTSKLRGMESLKDICIFSPGADSMFPLHINPFQFPKGLTLAEHIANLNLVFAGAFELPPPAPHFIDTCIEQIYLAKGWNINSRNDGALPYPTMKELFDSLNVAVQKSHYKGEILGNLRSILEVRIGSLLKREIGNVYNVQESSFIPEEWIERPVIIELESLGEGPANFMTLLISTLIRETLKIRKTQRNASVDNGKSPIGLNHIVFYEEAHNLIGQTHENIGDRVDPKVSATKFLVKMLAEVRALNEGIVIADQLPSVMAPEVLKNTGLKIGHRITANDDRELLGSTMSASPDQLAEQSVYLPGEALIFYEGILKPFKMSIAKWQRASDEYCVRSTEELIEYLNEYYSISNGETTETELIENYFSSVYDSPNDYELYQIVKDYPAYNEMLTRSRNIVLLRVESAFSTIVNQIRAINELNIVPAYNEGMKWLENKRKYIRNYAKSLNKEILNKISRCDAQLLDEKSVFSELSTVNGDERMTIDRKLSQLISEGNLWFVNNISIVKNYNKYALEMSATIIISYLRLLENIDYKHLIGNNGIKEILIKTKSVREMIRLFVDYNSKNPAGLLVNSDYYSQIRECCYSIRSFEIINDFNMLHKQLIASIKWKTQSYDSEHIKSIAVEYSNCYFKWISIATEYNENRTELLSLIISKYCELFDCLKYMDKNEELSHILFEPTRSVFENAIEYVSYREKDETLLSNCNDYLTLATAFRGFALVEINNMYYVHAKKTLNDTLAEINNEYSRLTKRQINDISDSYQATFGKCCDICAGDKSKSLLFENISLFYSVLTNFGKALPKEKQIHLKDTMRNTVKLIESFRSALYSDFHIEEWDDFDSCWIN